jgi:hypothetical protein
MKCLVVRSVDDTKKPFYRSLILLELTMLYRDDAAVAGSKTYCYFKSLQSLHDLSHLLEITSKQHVGKNYEASAPVSDEDNLSAEEEVNLSGFSSRSRKNPPLSGSH